MASSKSPWKQGLFVLAGAAVGVVLAFGTPLQTVSAKPNCEHEVCILVDYGGPDDRFVCGWATVASSCSMQSNGDCHQEACD
ncbi:MAG: hypothetical protein ACI84D_003013 [Thalassolituus oleivorans]|jgi:hypothetical protein